MNLGKVESEGRIEVIDDADEAPVEQVPERAPEPLSA